MAGVARGAGEIPVRAFALLALGSMLATLAMLSGHADWLVRLIFQVRP